MNKLILPLVMVAVSGAYIWTQQGPNDVINPASGAPPESKIASLPLRSMSPASSSAPLQPAMIGGSNGIPIPMPRLSRTTSVGDQVAPVTVAAQAGGAAGQYKDGSYDGSVADAYYGNVQVRATVQNGQLASVRILQYPSDRNTSRYINSQALPMLKQEAIQAQSGQVDFVSGATLTSQAFVRSLTDALDQANPGSTI